MPIKDLTKFFDHAATTIFGTREWLVLVNDAGEQIGQIYLRTRPPRSKFVSQVDLASVSIDPEHWRQGHFKRALAEVLEHAKRYRYTEVFAENVVNTNLVDWFGRQPEWVKEPEGSWDVPSYTYTIK